MSTVTRAELDRHMQAAAMYQADKGLHTIAHTLGETPAEIERWLTALGMVRRCDQCTAILDRHEGATCDCCKGGRRIYRGTLQTREQEPYNLSEVLRW